MKLALMLFALVACADPVQPFACPAPLERWGCQSRNAAGVLTIWGEGCAPADSMPTLMAACFQKGP